MIEKWHQSLDSGRQAVAALTDLSKVFDCIDKELLTTKLNAYGFNNLTPFVPIPDKKKKKKLNFYFHSSLWCLKRFYGGLKGLHKTF